MENTFKPHPFDDTKFKPIYEKIEYTIDPDFQDKLNDIKPPASDLSVEIFGYTVSVSRGQTNMNPREQLMNYSISEARIKNSYIIPESRKWSGFHSLSQVDSVWRRMCLDIISNITSIVNDYIDLTPMKILNDYVMPILTEDDSLVFPILLNQLYDLEYDAEHVNKIKNNARKERRLNRAHYTVRPGDSSGGIMQGNTNLDTIMRSWASTDLKSTTKGLANSFIANALTGTVHSIFNGIGAVTDRIILSEKKNKLFFQLLNDGTIEEAFIADAKTISGYVKWFIDNNILHCSDENPNAEKIRKSNSIMTEYTSKMDSEEKKRIILEALCYNPCNLTCYQKILFDFYDDYMSDKDEFDRLAKFSNIDLKKIKATLPKERIYNGEYCSSQEKYDELVLKCENAKQVYNSELQKLEEVYKTTDISDATAVSKAIEMIDTYKKEFKEYSITNETEYFEKKLKSLDYNTPWNEFLRDFPNRKKITFTEKRHFVSLLKETKTKAPIEKMPDLTKKLMDILNKKITNFNNGVEATKKSIQRNYDKICDVDAKIANSDNQVKIYNIVLPILNLVMSGMMTFWVPAIGALLISIVYHITGFFENIISNVYPILNFSLIIGVIGVLMYGISYALSGRYMDLISQYKTLINERDEYFGQIKKQQTALETTVRNADLNVYKEMISIFSEDAILKKPCSIETSRNDLEPSTIEPPNEQKESLYLGLGVLMGIISVIILIIIQV